MKRKFYLCLLIIITLGYITGCKLSKETMIKKSSNLSLYTLYSELEDNQKNAKDKYEGKIYEIDAVIDSVQEEYATINSYGKYKVKFNVNDLKKLKSGTRIKFVGKINSIESNEKTYNIDISNAYYISDITDINGYIEPYFRSSTNNGCNIRIDDGSNKIYKIKSAKGYYWNCTIGEEKIDSNAKVSIKGKVECESNSCEIITIESLKIE